MQYIRIDPNVSRDIPLKSIIDPFLLRIQFHFMSNKPTNRPDKPEWLFDHILKLIADQRKFFVGSVQTWYGQFANPQVILEVV